jgi:hypothetical protein
MYRICAHRFALQSQRGGEIGVPAAPFDSQFVSDDFSCLTKAQTRTGEIALLYALQIAGGMAIMSIEIGG